MQLLETQNFSDDKDGFRPDLAFTDGERKVYVKIITVEGLNERNTLLNSILKSVTFLKRANMVYVTLPKLYASIFDAKIFYENGIGLMTYDEKAVQEVIMPKVFAHESQNNLAELPVRFLEEINDLKDRLSALEQEVSALKVELSELRHARANIDSRPQSLEMENRRITRYEDVPEFMKNNPWIEILSKRGRE